MAIATLIDSTVRVTIRHSDNEPIASEVATASVSWDDAGAEPPLKPAAPGDRFMAETSFKAGRITRDLRYIAGIAGNIAAGQPRKWQKRGKPAGYARYTPRYARYFAASSLDGDVSTSSTSAPGRQSMLTKPGVCSTRRSQVRIAGKVARS